MYFLYYFFNLEGYKHLIIKYKMEHFKNIEKRIGFDIVYN